MRLGDHYLPHKYIKNHLQVEQVLQNSFWTPAEDPQIPRNANQSLQNEVEQSIKTKRETKNFRAEIHPGQGVVKEMFSHTRKPSHKQVSREFWNFRGKHNLKKKKKNHDRICTKWQLQTEKQLTHSCLSAGSKWRLDAEVQAMWSVLRVRTGVECRKDTLRGLMWHSNPNHGNARETKTDKSPFPWEGSNAPLWPGVLTERIKGSCPNNKGEQASCHYSLPEGREAGAQQPEAESKGPLQSRPQRLHLLPSLVGHQSLAKSS